MPACWTLTGWECTTTSGTSVASGTTALASVPASVLDDGNDLICTFTNQKVATLTLRKQWFGEVVGDDAIVTVSRGATLLDTLASDAGSTNELDTDATPVAVNSGDVLTLAESLADTNSGQYTGTVVCTGSSGLSGTTLTVGSADSAIVCTYTNTRRQADLSITKTDSETQVVSCSSTTYTITVRNNGPDAVNGAVVNDPAASRTGLTCSPGNTVTCSSSTAGACPTPTTTIGALDSPGYTLGTLPMGATVSFTFSCTVQ